MGYDIVVTIFPKNNSANNTIAVNACNINNNGLCLILCNILLVYLVLTLCAEHADTVAKIVENYDSEETCNQSCYHSANYFHALHPYEVVEAHSVES